VDGHPVKVNVSLLKPTGFTDAQACRIDQGKQYAVLFPLWSSYELFYFCSAKDGG
jgi:hypothetical protein